MRGELAKSVNYTTRFTNVETVRKLAKRVTAFLMVFEVKLPCTHTGTLLGSEEGGGAHRTLLAPTHTLRLAVGLRQYSAWANFPKSYGNYNHLSETSPRRMSVGMLEKAC